MDRALPLYLLGAVLTGGLLWNGLTLSRLEGRLAALEAAPPVTAPPAVARVQQDAAGSERPRVGTEVRDPWATYSEAGAVADERPATERPTLDLEDPKVREELTALVAQTQEREREQRQQEWAQRWTETVNQEVSTFATDNDWPEATRETVLAEFGELHEGMQAIRTDVHSGEMSWPDARTEMEALREDTEATLVGLIGEEQYEQLSERVMPGGRGRW